MPYAAAKAVAATFCYNIRWALTPVFGKDFLTLCTRPTSPSFAKFHIDPSIVRTCTLETERWREEGEAYRAHNAAEAYDATSSDPASVTSTPKSTFACPPWGIRGMKAHRVKPADIESGYGTDTDQSDKYLCSPQFSPQVSPRSQAWTPVNRSQSPSSPLAVEFRALTYSHSPPMRSHPGLSSPSTWLSSVPEVCADVAMKTKRTHSKIVSGNDDDDCQPMIACESAATPEVSDYVWNEEEDCGDGNYTKEELEAAETIMALSSADEVLPPMKRTRHRSKY